MTGAESTTPPQRVQRTTGGAELGRHSSREAKQLAAAILEVLAGQRTPAQAAEALGISLPRYYQLEAGGLRGLLAACEPRRKGRQSSLESALAALRQDHAKLQRDLARQQALVRLTQRAAGLAAVTTPPAKAGQKVRRRKPAARAATVAARLREEPTVVAAGPDDKAMSSASES